MDIDSVLELTDLTIFLLLQKRSANLTMHALALISPLDTIISSDTFFVVNDGLGKSPITAHCVPPQCALTTAPTAIRHGHVHIEGVDHMDENTCPVLLLLARGRRQQSC